jgi:acyl carrier protein
MPLQERINDIFQEVFDDPELHVTANTSAADIPAWDSVAQLKLVLAIEEAFNVQFTADETVALSNVGAFLDTLRKREIGG